MGLSKYKVGAEGPGWKEPSDGGEDEDSNPEGARLQRGQLSEGVRPRLASFREYHRVRSPFPRRKLFFLPFLVKLS